MMTSLLLKKELEPSTILDPILNWLKVNSILDFT